MRKIINGKMRGKVLTHMREVAFGNATQVAVHKTMLRAECLRDDDGLLRAAELKRLRKQDARRRGG